MKFLEILIQLNEIMKDIEMMMMNQFPCREIHVDQLKFNEIIDY